jgi:hypothetical protein
MSFAGAGQATPRDRPPQRRSRPGALEAITQPRRDNARSARVRTAL